MKRPFKIGETVVSIRDVEASNRARVVGYEENERGFILVQFADGMPRALPVQSMERVSDRKDESRSRPIAQGKDWAESKNLGDYLTRLGEAESDILAKEKQNEKSTR
jgi:hypothetical protein